MGNHERMFFLMFVKGIGTCERPKSVEFVLVAETFWRREWWKPSILVFGVPRGFAQVSLTSCSSLTIISDLLYYLYIFGVLLASSILDVLSHFAYT
jgi:hypothetical protein